MDRFKNNLKRQIEENPMLALAAAAALITAMSKLLDANTARAATRTHALEVQRRILNSR